MELKRENKYVVNYISKRKAGMDAFTVFLYMYSPIILSHE